MNIQTEEYLLVQPFHEGGQTTFFCWSFEKKAACANRNKLNLSIGMASGSSLSQLPQDWRSAQNQLNGDWYGSMVGQVKERYELPPITELEAELIRRFESRDERQCAEVTALMWKSMEASSFSHMEVKMLAAHLLHMLAMLAGRKSEYQQELDSAISHASLLVHVQQVIHMLIRQMKEEHVSYTDHPEVNRVIQYMLEHFKENIKIADLAKLVSINVDYLSTVFGKKTGLTPIAYLQNIRIEQAKRLLLHSKLNVEAIAFQTGFADDAYFIKVFKRMVGQTPNSFRRENNI
jgi:two-component system response regulator YesN